MKILFQGDSVTDVGRGYKQVLPNRDLGQGYVNLIASKLTCDNPSFEIYNRGVSGNRIADAYGRWIEDTLNMDFDIFSMLNGINDVGFQLRLGRGSDLARFEFIYDRMLFEVKETHPNCKIVLMQPFIFKMKDESNGCDIYNDWDNWSSHIRREGEVVQKLAKKYDGIYIPLFDIFDKAIAEIAPAEHWSLDCIHPTPAGHEIIARNWLDATKL